MLGLKKGAIHECGWKEETRIGKCGWLLKLGDGYMGVYYIYFCIYINISIIKAFFYFCFCFIKVAEVAWHTGSVRAEIWNSPPHPHPGLDCAGGYTGPTGTLAVNSVMTLALKCSNLLFLGPDAEVKTSHSVCQLKLWASRKWKVNPMTSKKQYECRKWEVCPGPNSS